MRLVWKVICLLCILVMPLMWSASGHQVEPFWAYWWAISSVISILLLAFTWTP